ncbi:MAG: hypothetical protein EXQ56_13220 [Acidobacteria bacterium]|nr:hypothetical protein [Acidobacteriota bacterium]
MTKRIHFFLALHCLFALGLIAGTAAPYDPWVGTWLLDLERSKFAAGFPKPKSQAIQVELSGETGVKFSSDTVEADGSKSHIEFTAAPDSKEYPAKGSSLVDSVTLTRSRPHLRTFTYKKAGEIVGSNDVQLWGSALLMTITSKDVRGGQTFESVAYYRKKLAQ